ncbi:hypothetical protein MNBD_IGNAVI01-1496 [hydrothermal vent metagenome]|uniref:DUF4625 domain-containing protein n=1 Tax=hydrothermal vent metagenome TaxID=652676 RepID=A0A3B1CXN9_9ZZZZ
MKKTILLTILIAVIFIGCSEEPDIKLFSPEAFAYTLDNGWELNATVQASGFAQIEKENSDLYYTHLNYTVNLFTPEDSLFDVDHDSVIDSTEEELMDLQIETQIELDSGFTAGNYTVEFIVEDAYSTTKDTISTKVVLE